MELKVRTVEIVLVMDCSITDNETPWVTDLEKHSSILALHVKDRSLILRMTPGPGSFPLAHVHMLTQCPFNTSICCFVCLSNYSHQKPCVSENGAIQERFKITP